MRVFVSYSTLDLRAAEDLVGRLGDAVPMFDPYFAPRSNAGGAYWMPKLGEELARADAVLLLLGDQIGPWQELEYYEAMRLGRASGRPRIVPVLLGESAPGLPFLDQLHLLRAAGGLDTVVVPIGTALAGLETGTDVPPLWRETNPYRGLAAFTSENAAFFFGREAETETLINVLAEGQGELLTLVGNSGVGKSSLILAGLFAALRSRIRPGGIQGDWPARLADSHRWLTVVIRPGERPLKALALGFVRLWLDDPAEADGQANAWARNFENGSELEDLAASARDRLAAPVHAAAPARSLLYVDQCEELYVRADPAQAARFASLLARAAADPHFAVLMSLRADFYGRFQADDQLFPVSRRIDLAPLSRAALENVIARPAARLGARFETPEIVAVVADAAAREPGALPLLSFLMTEVWENMRADDRADGVLRLPAGIVDIGRPLADRAEAFLAADPGRERTLRRLLTLRLAYVSKEGEVMRRRATQAECAADEWDAALALAAPEWRLLTLGEDDGVATVEVAHEMLLRKWPRLAGWVDEEREFLIWRSQLETARLDWEAAPAAMREEAVLTGLALATARNWMQTRGESLSEADCTFVMRSAEVDRARREEELRRARELAEERERSHRRAVWVGGVALAAAVIFLALGGWAAKLYFDEEAARDVAEHQTARAKAQRDLAVARRLADVAANVLAENPGETSAAAMIAVDSVKHRSTPSGLAVLRSALSLASTPPEPGDEGWADHVAVSRDGSTLAWIRRDDFGASGDGKPVGSDVLVVDADTFEPIVTQHVDGGASPTLSKDGKVIAVGGSIRQVLVGAADGKPLHRVEEGDGDVATVFSQSGSILYLVREDGRIEVRSAPDWRIVRELRFPRIGGASRIEARLTVDESALIVGETRNRSEILSRVPLDSGAPMLVPIRRNPLAAWWRDGLAGFRIAGDWLVSTHGDGSSRLWRIDGLKAATELRPRTSAWLTTISAVSVKGVVAAAAKQFPERNRSVIEMWSSDGAPIEGWRHDGIVRKLAFSANGVWLVGGGKHGFSARRTDGGDVIRALPHEVVTALAFERGGALLVGTESGRLVRYNLEARAIVADRQVGGRVAEIAVDAAGSRIALSLGAGGGVSNWTDIRITSSADSKRISTLSWNGSTRNYALSDDGRLFAAFDGTKSQVLVWGVDDGRLLGEVPIEGHFWGFDPSGEMLVVSDAKLAFYDIASGRRAAALGEPSGVSEAFWSTKDDTVIVYGSDKAVAAWDLDSGEMSWRAVRDTRGVHAWHSADGRLAAAYDKAKRRLLVEEAETGRTVAALSSPKPNAVAISNDASRLIMSLPIGTTPTPGNLADRAHLVILDIASGAQLWSQEVDTKVSRVPWLEALPGGQFVASGIGAHGRYARPWLYYFPANVDAPWLASEKMVSRLTHLATNDTAAATILADDRSVELHDVETGRLLWRRDRNFEPGARAVVTAAFLPERRGVVVAETRRGTPALTRVSVLDLRTGREIRRRDLGDYWVRDVEVSADGEEIVLALETNVGGALLALDTADLAERQHLPLHNTPKAIRILGDPNFVAVLDYASILEVWRLDAAKPLHRISMGRRADAFDYAPRARRAVTLKGDSLRVWNTADMAEIGSWRAGGNVREPAISPRGDLVAYASEHPTSGSAVRVWAPGSRAPPRAIPAENVRGITFSPDGSLIAIRTAESIPNENRTRSATVKVVDVGTLATRVAVRALPRGDIGWVGFSGDGAFLLLIETGKFDGRGMKMRRQSLRAFDVTSGGEVARRAVSSSEIVTIPRTSDVLYKGVQWRQNRLHLPAAPLDTRLADSADVIVGARLASTGLSRSYWHANQFFDGRSGWLRDLVKDRSPYNVISADLSADGRYALFSLREREWSKASPGLLVVKDTRTGESVAQLPRGHYFWTARLAGEVAILSELRNSYTETPENELVWWNWRTGEAKTLVTDNPVTSVAIDPRATCFATAEGSRAETSVDRHNVVGVRQVRIWDVATGQERLSIPTEFVFAKLALSPDCRRLAVMQQNEGFVADVKTGAVTLTIGPAGTARRDGTPHVVNETLSFRENRSWPGFVDGGRTLVIVTEAGVILRDLESGVTQHLADSETVKDVAISADGRLLALAAGGAVRIWDLHSRELVISIPVPGLRSIVFAGPGGGALIVNAQAGVFRLVWRPENLTDRACRAFADDHWQRSRYRITGTAEASPCERAESRRETTAG